MAMSGNPPGDSSWHTVPDSMWRTPMKAIQAFTAMLLACTFPIAFADSPVSSVDLTPVNSPSGRGTTVLTDAEMDSITGGGTTITLQIKQLPVLVTIPASIVSRLNLAIGCTTPDLCLLPTNAGVGAIFRPLPRGEHTISFSPAD